MTAEHVGSKPRGKQIGEGAIERYITENPGALNLSAIYGRQIQIGVGLVDIVGVRRVLGCTQLVMVEVKVGAINCAAVGQLTRYMKFLANYLECPLSALKGALVGSALEQDAALLAYPHGFECWLTTPDGFSQRRLADPADWLHPPARSGSWYRRLTDFEDIVLERGIGKGVVTA